MAPRGREYRSAALGPITAIASRRVVANGRVAPAVVIVEGETIARIEPWRGDRAALPAGAIDAGDRAVLPGLVDTHVHINEPGRADWEGFETGSAAAAAGGVTTIVVMPLNCRPAATTVEALLAEARAATGTCVVDFGFWGGAVPGNADQILPMLDAGALGMKCFLCLSGVDDFPACTEADLPPVMERLAQRGAPLLVHAEDPAVLDRARAASGLDDHPREYARYLASRPVEAETRAIERMARLCRRTTCPTHIVHVSAWEGAECVWDAAHDGLPFTGETCPHYLTFANNQVPDGATEFKCAPPIRDRAQPEYLWTALEEGRLTMVVSDHSPCPPLLKRAAEGDFARAWGGIASIEVGLSAVWSGAVERGIGLETICRWMCEAPARLAGLHRRKGRIAPGYDADLVVFDPDQDRIVEPEHMFQRHKVTPYAGMRLLGVVDTTILRGRVVFHDGRPVASGERRGVWLRERAPA
jgi:allantoinase